ncbi:hypothetical protein USDA257_c60630 [Sinorhizobium fredii USDA 257]|uniref:Uncharacterized protein n=1 Tax=Sinorhizobium fredii (strain USDA 257) TaxID=1185652 RepID=I3XFA9_SINF2|nr:hypothetical protein USDA257_c60630 [Sinorhizobium fredii USDA 257]
MLNARFSQAAAVLGGGRRLFDPGASMPSVRAKSRSRTFKLSTA